MSDTTTNGAAMAPPQAPAWLPEKFWDPETNDICIEALARSYNELERLMSNPANVPGTPGAALPDGPDGYELDVDDLLDVDADVNQRLHTAGFSNEQAQLVYDLAAERLVPMVQQMTSDVDDARQLDRVTEHFGGAERFDAMRPQLRTWAQANLEPDVLHALAGSAEGVIAIHAMMQNSEPGLNGASAPISGADEADLKRMMADPRYWRDREPTFVGKVREGFRQLYPEG